MEKPRWSHYNPKGVEVEKRIVSVYLGDLGTPASDLTYTLFAAPCNIELVDAYVMSQNSLGTHSANYVSFDLRNETDSAVIASRDQNAAAAKEANTHIKLELLSAGTVAGTHVDEGDVLTLLVDDTGAAQDIGEITVVVEYLPLLDDQMQGSP